tara:strand:- start:29761 stop:30984 length:1224 start_codon:yes stop_codon:yes gene_type:complete
MSRGLPNTVGIEAAYGTVFHDYAADCAELGLDPQHFVGDGFDTGDGFGWLEFDQAMADNMLNGLDYLWAAADVPGARMLVEKRVSLEHWVGKGEFGTTDAAIIDPLNWRLIVFDWKYGAGVPVDPFRNDQALLYALGTWTTFARAMFFDALCEKHGAEEAEIADSQGAPWEDDIEVHIVIEQPRVAGGGGVWRTTMGEVLAEGELIRRDAKRTEDPDAPFNPGVKQCQFCPAARANVCKPRAEMVLRELGQDLDDLDLDFAAGAEMEFPKALTPEQRSQILLHKPLITKWLDQLHEEAYKDAMRQQDSVPGMKLVDGRNPPRKWRDEDKAEMILEHDFAHKAYTKKLLTPTAVEDKVGKRVYRERFARLVDTGESKPQLVPATDKREALPDLMSDFDGLDDDDKPLV